MESTTRCPDNIDLYAYLDGELDSSAFGIVDRHLLDCSQCRDEVRRLKVFHRTLFAEISPDRSAEDDELFSVADFKKKLMGRMATSDEVRTQKPRFAQRPRIAVALGAAAVLMVVIAASFVGVHFIAGRSSSQESVVVNDDRDIVDKEVRKLTLLRLESDFRSGIAAGHFQSVGVMKEWRRKYESAGGSFIPVLERIGKNGSPIERRWIAGRLATEIGADSAHVARHLTGDADVEVRAALVADAWRWPRDIAVALVVAAGDDVPRRVAVAALQKIKSSAAKNRLIEMAMTDGADDVIAALSGGVDADAVLLEAYLRGSQSSLLRQRLAKAPALVATARTIAQSSAESNDRRCRAMILLGDLRDRPSAAFFERRLSDRVFAEAAAAALARLDDDEARLVLARRLSPRALDRAESGDVVQSAIARAIRSMDERASRFYLDRIAREDGQFSANYVVAAGLCGNERVLPALERLLDDDMLTLHAVRAIDAIDDRGSTAILVKLSRSTDGRVRDEAKSALKRRGVPDGGGRSKPLVDAHRPSAPIRDATEIFPLLRNDGVGGS